MKMNRFQVADLGKNTMQTSDRERGISKIEIMTIDHSIDRCNAVQWLEDVHYLLSDTNDQHSKFWNRSRLGEKILKIVKNVTLC